MIEHLAASTNCNSMPLRLRMAARVDQMLTLCATRRASGWHRETAHGHDPPLVERECGFNGLDLGQHHHAD